MPEEGKQGINQRKIYDLLFLGVLLLLVFFNYFHHNGLGTSDEYRYARLSSEILQGSFSPTLYTFDHRFAVLLPTAFAIKLLGFGYYSVTLWSLFSLCLLLAAVYVGFRKKQQPLGLLAAAIIGLNPLLIDQSADISADIIVMVFSILSVLILYRLSRKPILKPLWWALLFVFTGFVAFTAKTTFLYVVPFLAGVMLFNLVKGVNRSFIYYTLALVVLIALAYFGAYYWILDDPLFRLKAIEVSHNQSKYSFHFANAEHTRARLFRWPINLFFGNISFTGIFVLLLPMLSKISFKQRLNFTNYFGIYFIYILLLHWFGTTSLKEWLPLTMSERMWLLVIPAGALLVARLLYLYLMGKQGTLNRYVMFAFLGLAGIISLYIAWHYGKPKGLLIGFYAALFIIPYLPYLRKLPAGILIVAFLLPYVGIQVQTVLQYDKQQITYFFEKEIFHDYAQLEDAQLVTDLRMKYLYGVYYGFDSTQIRAIDVLSWEDINTVSLPDVRRFYFSVNDDRMDWVKENTDYIEPSYISAIRQLKAIRGNGSINVYEVNHAELLLLLETDSTFYP